MTEISLIVTLNNQLTSPYQIIREHTYRRKSVNDRFVLKKKSYIKPKLFLFFAQNFVYVFDVLLC